MNRPALVMPSVSPAYDDVVLRAFGDADVGMVMDLSTDSYVPLTGSLPGRADREAATAYIERQRSRLTSGVGYSFCVADSHTDRALGTVGLWLDGLTGGLATAGYSVAPRARGRGIAGKALTALTTFAWSIEGLQRIELYVEPWKTASVRTAEVAGYGRSGAARKEQKLGGRRVEMLVYTAVRPEV